MIQGTHHTNIGSVLPQKPFSKIGSLKALLHREASTLSAQGAGRWEQPHQLPLTAPSHAQCILSVGGSGHPCKPTHPPNHREPEAGHQANLQLLRCFGCCHWASPSYPSAWPRSDRKLFHPGRPGHSVDSSLLPRQIQPA